MTAPIKMAKRAAAGTLALAVCLTGGVIGAGAAQAAANFKFDQRLGGADRFETAVNASKAAFADGAGDVIIVQDDALADGLTASYLAGVKKAPILYVKQNEVPAATAAELTRLKAERIFIVGGSAVVSTGVQSSLSSNGRTVTRISGTDRYDTAAKVATSDSNDVGTVFIANGDAPADALAAGPIAYASTNPILLTRAMEVPASTKAALDQLNETNRIVLGGNTVVSTSTYTDVNATERLSGKDRQGTAVAIADYATANEGFSKANAALVGSEDRNTADALIAAPLLGQTKTPILFTTRGGLGTTSKTYLQDNAAALTGVGYVFGGNAAVSQAIADEATAAAGGDGTTPPVTPPTDGTKGTIVVTPANDVDQTLADETSNNTARDDNRQYQATGLTDGVTYRITLVNSDNIRTTNDGVTFRSSVDSSSASGFSVDPGTKFAEFLTINGGAANGGNSNTTITAVPVNGTISFEIDGTAVGSVTPVIYLNGGPGKTAAEGGPSVRLETSATAAGEFAAATEAFGLGGKVTYVGQLGANGDIDATVASVNKEGNSFSTDATLANGATPAAASARYTYDDSDEFQLGGQTVGLAAFEAQLSSGDRVTGTFAQDAGGNSTFNLDDLNPDVIQAVTAERADGANGAITVEGLFAGNLREIDSFVVQRAAIGDANGDGVMDEIGDFRTIATVPASDTDADEDNVQLRYVDTNAPAGDYRYRLAAINDGDQGAFSASGSSEAGTGTGPTVLDTRLVAGGNDTAPFVLGIDDSFTIVTSAVVANLDNTQQLRVSDTDGTVGDIIGNGTAEGGNADFTLNTANETVNGTSYPAGRVITVTLTDDITPVSAQTTGVNTLGFPATITDAAGITSTNGAPLVLTGDLTIENDAPTAGPIADTTAPTFTAPRTPTGNTVTFTGSEAIAAASVAAGDVTAAAGAGNAALTVTNTQLAPNGRDVVATLSRNLATGDTVTLTADSVTDTAATPNTGPVADVVATAGGQADTTAPTFTTTPPVAGATTVTFRGSEAIAAASVAAGDVTAAAGAGNAALTVTNTVRAANGTDVVATLSRALATGDTVTLTADSVTDSAGNTGPVADVVATTA